MVGKSHNPLTVSVGKAGFIQLPHSTDREMEAKCYVGTREYLLHVIQGGDGGEHRVKTGRSKKQDYRIFTLAPVSLFQDGTGNNCLPRRSIRI